MVTPRPLKLKTQVGASGRKKVADHLPIARLWVDTGIFHLDTSYDYEVPEEFAEVVVIGVRVKVEFGSSMCEGIIIDRLESSTNAGGLKQILKVLSPHPVATSQTIDLIATVARRWGGAPYDVLRSAIPPRSAAVDKEDFPRQISSAPLDTPTPHVPPSLRQQKVRAFWSLPPVTPREKLIADLAVARSKLGQVLLILPDERELLATQMELEKYFGSQEIIRIDGHLSRSERYRNFLRVNQGEGRITLGLRGAIFAPLDESGTIILAGDSSENLYESRSPGWNARDIAFMRADESKVSLLLIGYSPSLETARLIESGWLLHPISKRRQEVHAVAQEMGELIPRGAFSIIRNALKSGPVLFLLPRKGYGNSVLCRKCRNIALCTCGGRLQLLGSGQSPRCSLCFKIYPEWKCAWCQGGDIYLVSRGIDRFSEELGRAFPNYPLINSSGDHIVDTVPNESALVLATAGAQPRNAEGYSAVALLEGLRFFGHSELRSSESGRELFFESAAMISKTGKIFLALDPVHPIVAALAQWDPSVPIRRELREREELNFPPYFRFICIDVEIKESSRFHSGLIKAQSENRISADVKITGPHAKTEEVARIILAVPVSEAPILVDFVHEIQRKRSIARKPLFTIRVDPYTLT